MANFFPVNTPLINYFFYKAPFVQNGFSLVDYHIQSGGNNYSVGDIIIFTGGIFTTPFCAKVNTVEIGVITSLLITNAGIYSTVPTALTQAFTSGTGTGITLNSLIFDSNFLQPPGPNIPLSGGFLFFYEDENRTVQANTYSDVTDPQNPTVNPNPIRLGTSGDCPLFYLDNRYYYIVITDNTGDQSNPVEVLEHYSPAEIIAKLATFNDNFIVNPQFNYPIIFYKTTDDEGEITAPTTRVAWAWDFIEDQNTDTQNYVTFNNISGQSIEGSPINQVRLNCTTVSADETRKDFTQIIGAVDLYSEENLTFSAQMINVNGLTISVQLILYLNYGEGGSPSSFTLLDTFSVGATRNKFISTFEMPSISGFTIEEGNFSAIIVRPALKSLCVFGMTNVLVEPGIVVEPIFNTESLGFSKGEILGSSTNILEAGLDENYSNYMYNQGLIFPYADTGTMVICPKGSDQPFRLECLGQQLQINGYTNNIPNRRIYDVIGSGFEGSGTLIADASANIVTVTCTLALPAHSTWLDVNTGFTITLVKPALQFGWSAEITGLNQVTLTFNDKFAPDQTPGFYGVGGQSYTPLPGVMSYWTMNDDRIVPAPVTFTTLNPGSPTEKAVVQINFARFNIPTIPTLTNPSGPASSSFIDCADFTDNTRGTMDGANVLVLVKGIFFEYDGQSQLAFLTSTIASPTVPFKSTNTQMQNLEAFVNTVANPFVYTVTVNGVPAAGSYLLYSEPATDFYLWITVNGAGTDPMVAGRTGVVCPILSSDTIDEVAIAVAKALNNATFGFPQQSDLPTIPTADKLSWYINL